jgi:hypothetical protein
MQRRRFHRPKTDAQKFRFHLPLHYMLHRRYRPKTVMRQTHHRMLLNLYFRQNQNPLQKRCWCYY